MRSARLARGAPAALLGLAALFAAGAAAADVVRREAVGVVAAPSGESLGDLRRSAIRAGVVEAVVVAAQQEAPHADPRALAAAVQDDPFEYAVRYRLLEDRGERPAMLLAGAEREYVVMVEAHVDRQRLRRVLAARGLSAPAPHLATGRMAVVVEGVDRYETYAQLRDALRAYAPRAETVELARGRVLFSVDSDESAEALLRSLRAGVQGSLVRLSRDPGRLDLRWVDR